jgi:hypothetical protein
MITEFHLGPMYDQYFRPYMVPEGKKPIPNPRKQMNSSCASYFEFLAGKSL